MTANSPKEALKIIQWVDPDAHTSVDIATVDSSVDTIGFRYALVIVNVGDSAGTWAIQVEASATTGGTYADVTGALISVGLTDDDSVLFGIIDLQGAAVNNNRWLQLNGTTQTGAIDLGVTLILMNPKDTAESDYIDYTDPTFEV